MSFDLGSGSGFLDSWGFAAEGEGSFGVGLVFGSCADSFLGAGGGDFAVSFSSFLPLFPVLSSFPGSGSEDVDCLSVAGPLGS